MDEPLDQVLEIQVSLAVTQKDLKALEELGQRLALQGHPIVTAVNQRTAVDLAVSFIVGAELWNARQALGLPGAEEG
jgi:hypothetical protein